MSETKANINITIEDESKEASNSGTNVTRRRYERHAPLEGEDSVVLENIIRRAILTSVDVGYDGDASNVNSPEKFHAIPCES